MTDTGQVPGEGQPENAGGHPGQPQPAAASSPADAGPTELPGMVSPPGEYPYLDRADGVVEDDDLLLMPGAQGAWSEQPAPQPLPQPQETHHGPEQQPQQGVPFDAAAQGATGFEPVPAQAGDHESGGRDSGSVDLSAVRIPQPAAPQQQDRARAAAPATPQRRPLHMGPPVPDATGGVVRSLADRGPADAPSQSAGRHAGPPTGGPEYFDAPAAAPETAPGEQPVADAQPGVGLPYAEQTPGDPAAQAFAAPYAEQSYGGQLSAEQTYGAAGQGPLPGPQLGEIPSQVPSWNEAVAQAAHLPQTAPAPAEETVAPEAPAAAEAAPPVPQDAAPPAEQPQPMPLPAEDAAAAVDGAPVVADVAGAVQDAQAAAPAPPQEVAPAALPEAAVPGQDGTPVADAAVPDDAPANAPVAEAAAQEVPAAADAAVAAQQPEAVAAGVPQQPVNQDPPAEAEPAAQEQAAEAPAPAVAEADGEPVEPVTEQPAAVAPDATAEPAQAPKDEQTAGQEPPVDRPEAADQPQPAEPAPAVDASQPQPDAAEPEAVVTEPEAVPAEAGADDGAAVEPAAPLPVTAPQGPVAQPVSESGAPLEQTAIEPPEAQEAAAGQPQSDAPADAAGPYTAEVPAPQGADATEQQPVAAAPDHLDEPNDPTAEPAPGTVPAADATSDEPAEAVGAEAPTETAGTEETAGTAGTDVPAETAGTDEPAEADAPADLPADAPPVAVHIPAQASGEPSTTGGTTPQAAAAGEEPATVGPPPGSAPAADAPADEMPEQQDIAELVELGEGQHDDQPQTAGQRPAAEPGGSEVPDDSDPAVVPGPAEDPSPAAGYDDSERAAVHRVMRERRDIRNGFRSDAIPNDVLLRVLEAAHTAPSVGHSQPWDFVVIRSDETREKMHQLATAQREAYAKSLPKARAKQFRELKIEAILETPVNIVVTADSTRGGRHTLGRHTQPQMAPYSSALAVENLWLAARAEGLGVGWVSFFDEREMVRELGLPEHLEVVAYLCIGYVDEFPEEPELLQAGWSKRRPLSWVVHEETYGRRALPGESPHDLLQETLQGIRPLDAKALGEAWERQKRMTKPAGALGMLEIISAQLSGLSRKCPPPIPEPAAVAIFAGDHGVHAQGVTPWPQEVTGQMVANFLGGGAVCNAFANQVGAEVCVVDVGVASDLPATPGLLPRKVRAGTADFTAGPAMTQEDVLKAIEVGIDTARDLVAAGNKALLTGEMGIANTTTSAALISVYTGDDPVEVTGRGTGINDETHARKVDVVRRALELHQPDPADPIGVLAAIGGLEHAALVGLILGGASLRTPVILDGVSAGAAALVARAI
ncbi:5,6-dimethylbenzimidazole synthase, partial [Streptomyces decoyicus]